MKVRPNKKIYLAAYQIKNAERIKNQKKEYAAKNVEAIRAYQKAYRQKNAEKLKAAKQAWAKLNSEKRRQSQIKWRQRHAQLALERPKIWRKRNQTRSREIGLKWYRKNSDKVCEYRAQSRKLNPEKWKTLEAKWRKNSRETRIKWYKANYDTIRKKWAEYAKSPRGKMAAANARGIRRARKRGCIAAVTTKELMAIKSAAKGICFYCKKLKPLTFDHIIPLSKGGSHTKDNIVMACGPCNFKKHNKPINQFLTEEGLTDVMVSPVQLNLIVRKLKSE